MSKIIKKCDPNKHLLFRGVKTAQERIKVSKVTKSLENDINKRSGV